MILSSTSVKLRTYETLVAAVPEITHHDVEDGERPGVADVHPRVDGGTTHVQTHFTGPEWLERLLAAGQRVVDGQRGWAVGSGHGSGAANSRNVTSSHGRGMRDPRNPAWRHRTPSDPRGDLPRGRHEGLRGHRRASRSTSAEATPLNADDPAPQRVTDLSGARRAASAARAGTASVPASMVASVGRGRDAGDLPLRRARAGHRPAASGRRGGADPRPLEQLTTCAFRTRPSAGATRRLTRRRGAAVPRGPREPERAPSSTTSGSPDPASSRSASASTSARRCSGCESPGAPARTERPRPAPRPRGRDSAVRLGPDRGARRRGRLPRWRPRSRSGPSRPTPGWRCEPPRPRRARSSASAEARLSDAPEVRTGDGPSAVLQEGLRAPDGEHQVQPTEPAAGRAR